MLDNETTILAYYPRHVFNVSSHNDHEAIKCLRHLLTRSKYTSAVNNFVSFFFGCHSVRAYVGVANFHEMCETIMLLSFSMPDIIDDDDDVNNGSRYWTGI